MLRNKLVGEINCFMDFNFQGSPLPLLLDNDTSSLMDHGVGNDSVILVDEDSWLKYPKKNCEQPYGVIYLLFWLA
jgi:hypothetical protein